MKPTSTDPQPIEALDARLDALLNERPEFKFTRRDREYSAEECYPLAATVRPDGAREWLYTEVSPFASESVHLVIRPGRMVARLVSLRGALQALESIGAQWEQDGPAAVGAIPMALLEACEGATPPAKWEKALRATDERFERGDVAIYVKRQGWQFDSRDSVLVGFAPPAPDGRQVLVWENYHAGTDEWVAVLLGPAGTSHYRLGKAAGAILLGRMAGAWLRKPEVCDAD